MAKKHDKTALPWFIGKVKRQIPTVGLLSVLHMLSAASSLWLAWLSKDLIDAATALIAQQKPENVWEYVLRPEIANPAVTVFALIVFQVLCSILISNLRVRAEGRVEIVLKRSAFQALLNAEYTAVYRFHTGEMLTRMTADASLSARNFVSLLPSALSMITRLIGGLILLTALSPYFTLGVLVIGVIVAIISRFYGAYAKKLHKKCQETEGRTRSFMQEVLSNLLTVKAFSNQPYMEEKLEEYQKENFRQRLRRNLVHNTGNTAVHLLLTSMYYIALIFGVVLLVAGSLTVGMLAALLQVFEQIQAPLRNASGLLPQYYSMMASVERLRDIELLEKEDNPTLSRSREDLFAVFKGLSLTKVDFAYDADTPVLNEVSLRVHRGEIVALIGESGIGKSTTIKLLLALLSPQSGRVAVECERTYPVNAATRIFFSYVPQGNTVFSGTLRENVAFFRPDIADEKIREALQLACLDDFLQALPNGLDTLIGEHCYGVSEGQAQRIAVARALLHDAPVLLLDECTSALDVKTEKRLLTNIREMTDKTVLMVSHKNTAVEGCDRIVRLRDGKLTEITKST